MTRRRQIAHIGVTVTDLDRALDWYRDVLGFEPIVSPVAVQVGDGHPGALAADVFGPSCRRFRVAHLAGANGTALELFEFVEPRTERRVQSLEYWRTGAFHFCVVAPDIDHLVEQIEVSGGKRRTRVWDMFPGEPYRMCYCEDPFGTIIELYTHSHERTYARREPE